MFEHSCCYCNSQKNLLNAFLHDVRCFMNSSTSKTQCQRHFFHHRRRRRRRGRHTTVVVVVVVPSFSSFLAVHSCFWRVSTLQCVMCVLYVWAVSSCTTLLLVIGRRDQILHRKRSCFQSVKLLVWYCLRNTKMENRPKEKQRAREREEKKIIWSALQKRPHSWAVNGAILDEEDSCVRESIWAARHIVMKSTQLMIMMPS